MAENTTRTADLMRGAMQALERFFPPGTKIVLLAFDATTDKDNVNYIANTASRSEISTAMRQVLARWEGRDHKGSGSVN